MNYSGTLKHVCISARKGTPKHSVPTAELQAGHGIIGDAHAGNWHRQVSLLSENDIQTMRERGLNLKPGAFGENLVVSGLNLSALGVGTRLRIGPAEIRLTQLGKECHTRCAIYFRTGDCIMPRNGLFAEVLTGAVIRPGMQVSIDELVPPPRPGNHLAAKSDYGRPPGLAG